MTRKSITRQELLQSFGGLATQFTSSLQEAKKLEKSFDASRAKLINAISDHLQEAQKKLPANNPLQASLENFVTTMAQTSREWDEKVAGRQKGVEFRQGFEDSLLVFVSGKVKSGKSSLGNYMAWGHTDPTDSIKRETPPERYPQYKSHAKVDVEGGDKHKEAENKREFRVGATEATSSIQSFNIPGLTWVDSPGLHSLKAENGNLAREYLDHADLILYTMKSDSPGRASDLAEIKELIRKDKRTLLLLTGSDDIEEDINDDGDLVQCVIMKDVERRKKQQSYVRDELKEIPGTERIEIFSISSRYAQEHANDAAALFDSGLGVFCATLQEICQSEGVKIKQRVPMSNLYNFLRNCENDLAPYQHLIYSFRPELQKARDKLEKGIPIQMREGKVHIQRFIDQFFDELEARRNDQDHTNNELKAFHNKLGKKFEQIINKQLQAITDDLTEDLDSVIKNTYQNSLLPQIPDFKLDTITEQVEAGTRSGSKKRNSGIGAFAGGVVGLLLGGPAGAAIGSTIGGGLGSMTGDSASIRYRDIQITVGDNLQDIRKKLRDIYGDALESTLKEKSNLLWKNFDDSIQDLLEKISSDIQIFQFELKSIHNKAKNAL